MHADFVLLRKNFDGFCRCQPRPTAVGERASKIVGVELGQMGQMGQVAGVSRTALTTRRHRNDELALGKLLLTIRYRQQMVGLARDNSAVYIFGSTSPKDNHEHRRTFHSPKGNFPEQSFIGIF